MTLHASVTLFTSFTFVTTGTLWTLEEEEEEEDVLNRVQDSHCPRARTGTQKHQGGWRRTSTYSRTTSTSRTRGASGTLGTLGQERRGQVRASSTFYCRRLGAASP